MKRVAIVTGAGRGLGRIVALALAGDGWTTIVTGRDEEMLAAVVAEAGPLADAIV